MIEKGMQAALAIVVTGTIGLSIFECKVIHKDNESYLTELKIQKKTNFVIRF
ncbi:MAG: hypothetical protein RBG13Loki_2719 [Promethearchaeota archaeon CR_4]|nr:MAG: hypothetical protein RBG13Loki_2719 [Candidatus Lokiarchaeota archaeon CR_4]